MKKKRKKQPVLKKTRIFFVLTGFILAAGLLIFYYYHKKTLPPPVFEEEYVTTSRLEQVVGRVDQAIYETLYLLDIKKKDITFSKVIPRHEASLDWDFTELSVVLPGPDFISRLETLITRKLTELGPDVIFKPEKPSSESALFSITIFGHLTHTLKLYLKAVEPIAETAKLPRVAFIIDDIGYDITIADGFMGLKIPVCLSVLPDAPHSKEIARDIAKSNKEMLLHLPMEPEGYPEVNPGNNALMLSMEREAIQKTVRENIEKLPGVKGVNHHMGSRFSQDYVKMKHVLDEIKKYNLYYIDSRTTNLTVAFKVAKALGVPAAEKSLFIDNDLDEKILTYQMERLLGIARSRGEAIGIGHPHPETLDILKKYTVQLMKDFEVVPASELVN